MERRLLKELSELANDPPTFIRIDQESVVKNLTEWTVELDGAPGSIYANEHFRLKFIFSSKYPFDSPQVLFVPPYVPEHPHIYSNGHICLSILGDDWTPALCVRSVCLSILSMLSSCKRKTTTFKQPQFGCAEPGRGVSLIRV